MALWCYILRCADGKYYTGGYCTFTSKRRPVELIWSADFPTRYEALDAELKVKKWSRAKKEALAAECWERVSYFAKPPSERKGPPPR